MMSMSQSRATDNIIGLIRDEGFQPDYRQSQEFIRDIWSLSIIRHLKDGRVQFDDSKSGVQTINGVLKGMDGQRMAETVRGELFAAGFDNQRFEQDIGLKSLCVGLVDEILANNLVQIPNTQDGFTIQGPIIDLDAAVLGQEIAQNIVEKQGEGITGEQNAAIQAITRGIITEIETNGFGEAAIGGFTLVPVVGEAMVAQLGVFWWGSGGVGAVLNTPIHPGTITITTANPWVATDDGVGGLVGPQLDPIPIPGNNTVAYQSGVVLAQFIVPFAGQAPTVIDYSWRTPAVGSTLYGSIF